MVRPVVRHWSVFALAAVVVTLAIAASTAQEGPGAYVPVTRSCGQATPCHATWSPPLKAMARIQPPSTVGADVGTEFDYTVRYQESWAPKVGLPTVQYVIPDVDISGAPSPRFGG